MFVSTILVSTGSGLITTFATVEYSQLREVITSTSSEQDELYEELHDDLYQAFHDQVLQADDDFVSSGWDEGYQYF